MPPRLSRMPTPLKLSTPDLTLAASAVVRAAQPAVATGVGQALVHLVGTWRQLGSVRRGGSRGYTEGGAWVKGTHRGQHMTANKVLCDRPSWLLDG
jgi:hypothetical protein